MKLYISPRAPSPRRVTMFIAEKGITGIEQVVVEIGRNQHRSADYLAKSPLAKVPVLELDDGRVLGETRAICTYLEGLFPEPNLMGMTFDERAFIEMADRRVELYLMGAIANCIRHTHPGLAPLEQPQFADFGHAQGEKILPGNLGAALTQGQVVLLGATLIAVTPDLDIGPRAGLQRLGDHL